MNESIWNNKIEFPAFPALSKDTSVEVLIIGGGIAGLLCAMELAERNINYMLIEADRICRGVTCNTTAKITVGHGLIYHKLVHEFDEATARGYYDANRAALAKYRTLSNTIDCDFETQDNYIYALDTAQEIRREMATLKRLGINAEFVTEVPLPFRTKGAVRYSAQAQFHPLKFLSAIAKDKNIFEHTTARNIVGNTVITDNATITAQKIVVATHFPILNKHGSYFLKMYQHRSYVLALENTPKIEGMYLDADSKGLSLRMYKNLLLLGGASHRTGKASNAWRELSAFAKQHFAAAREVCRFATQDCMTLDGIPYIGQYSKCTPHLLVATGFNKWGMTSSMAAATLLADIIEKKDNPYAALFSPSRTIWRRQLLVNAAESAVHLLTPTRPRCPHLGCALQWNKNEHSWDCSCHGSRFTEAGKLMDGPATTDITKK